MGLKIKGVYFHTQHQLVVFTADKQCVHSEVRTEYPQVYVAVKQ